MESSRLQMPTWFVWSPSPSFFLPPSLLSSLLFPPSCLPFSLFSSSPLSSLSISPFPLLSSSSPSLSLLPSSLPLFPHVPSLSFTSWQFGPHRCLPFTGLTITVTGLDESSRKKVAALCNDNGGRYSGELTKDVCTHLLVGSKSSELMEGGLVESLRVHLSALLSKSTHQYTTTTGCVCIIKVAREPRPPSATRDKLCVHYAQCVPGDAVHCSVMYTSLLPLVFCQVQSTSMLASGKFGAWCPGGSTRASSEATASPRRTLTPKRAGQRRREGEELRSRWRRRGRRRRRLLGWKDWQSFKCRPSAIATFWMAVE